METVKRLFGKKSEEKNKIEPGITVLAAVSLMVTDPRPPAYHETPRSVSPEIARNEIEKGYGCYVLNDAGSANSPDIEVDIVFIHGLRGNRYATWAAGDIMWPRDLLLREKSMKNARVITYGCDIDAARFLDEVSQSNTFQHANQLLLDLKNIRKRKEEQERPIVFVCHSLGGIVVKMALNESKQSIECDHPNGLIYRCTQGVIFLGTPHRGSDAIGLGIVIANVAKAAFQQPNLMLLEELQHNSPTLMMLSAAFSRMIYKKDLKIYSFAEELPIPGIGLIVDASSAFLDDVNEIKGMIHANHMDMARFRDPRSNDYRRILSAIEDLSETAVQAVKAKTLPRPIIKDPGSREVSTNIIAGKSSKFALPLQIPYLRHQNFTGREQELASMRNALKVDAEGEDTKMSTTIYGLVGTGGIGKTQLAIEYAYRYAHDYSSVFWVNGASHGEIDSSYLAIAEAIVKAEAKKAEAPDYVEIAKRLELTGALQEDGKLIGRGDSINDAVISWLSTAGNENWLLIFDNVDDLESFELEDFLPKTPNGFILITSRRTEISNIASINDVDGMDPDTAVELLLTSAELKKSVKETDISDAHEIVEHLGYMPLAIAHAGAFVKNMGIPLSSYITEYYEKAFKDVSQCVKQPVGWNYRNETAATTWEVSFSAIMVDRPAAAEILLMCSFLNYQGIPEKIFYDESNFQEKMDAKSNINRLISFSLAKRTVLEGTSDGITIHPVVHTWARERLRRDEKIKVLRRLGEVWYSVSRRGYSEDEIGIPVLTDEYDILADVHMPFVGEYLQEQIVHIGQGGDIDEATEAVIAEVVRDDEFLGFADLGASCYRMDENDSQEETDWRLSVIKLCEKYRGQDDAYTLRAYRYMGGFLAEEGHKEEALEYYTRALSGCEKSHSEDHELMTEMRLSIGLFYYAQGRLDEASKYHDVALESIQKRANDDPRRFIDALINKRYSLMEGKMYEDALRCCEVCLAFSEKILGMLHIETINALGDMVNINCHLGRYDEAVKYYKIEIETREKARGADDMDTIRMVYRLAMLYIQQGYRPKSQDGTGGIVPHEQRDEANPALIAEAEKLISGLVSIMKTTTKEIYSIDFCSCCDENRYVEAYLCLTCEEDDAPIPGVINCPGCVNDKEKTQHRGHELAYISKEGKISKIKLD